jgi:DNA primase
MFRLRVAGDVFKFVMLMKIFRGLKAVRKLAQKSGINQRERKEDKNGSSRKKRKFLNCLKMPQGYYHRCFMKGKSARLQETIQKKEA